MHMDHRYRDASNEHRPGHDEPTPNRRDYRPPSLSIFGDLLQLTRQGGPGPTSDSGSNMMGDSSVIFFGSFTDEPGSFADE
jgi:hypothetical protein